MRVLNGYFSLINLKRSKYIQTWYTENPVVRIPIVIQAYIVYIGEDDGISQELKVEITSVEIKE
jgi:hypothetical protein